MFQSNYLAGKLDFYRHLYNANYEIWRYALTTGLTSLEKIANRRLLDAEKGVNKYTFALKNI